MPVGGAQYELYCEVAPVEPAAVHEASRTFWQRAVERFRAVLAAVEHEEQRRLDEPAAEAEAAPGLGTRLKRRLLRWLAERIAEQRLLWHLRQVDHATAAFPDDIDAARALDQIRTMLARDRDRHRLWMVVNAAAFVGSGLLMPVPGPNVVAYYFAFRLVGHFLSYRGAQKGLAGVEWHPRPLEMLTALRDAAGLERAAREKRVHEIAERLGLRGLPRFYLRTVVPGA